MEETEVRFKKLAYWLDELLRGHDWDVTTEDVYGPATHTRVCLNCGVDETYLYDFKRRGMVWRRGTFRPDGHRYFIVAASRSAYVRKVEEIREHVDPDIIPLWIKHPMDVREMCLSFPWPRVRLAEDWIEADVVVMKELLKIFQTGHS